MRRQRILSQKRPAAGGEARELLFSASLSRLLERKWKGKRMSTKNKRWSKAQLSLTFTICMGFWRALLCSVMIHKPVKKNE